MLDPQKIMEEILKKQGIANPLQNPGSSIHINSLLDDNLSKLSKEAGFCILKEDGIIQNIYITPDMECVDLNWTDADMIVPLFYRFMLNNNSIIRFKQIYETDPEYYFGKLKEAYPETLPVFLPLITTSSIALECCQWNLVRMKAFAVHFSEREKDIRQLERFYKKAFQKLNFSFPELDRSQPLDLSRFVMGCTLDMVDVKNPGLVSITLAAMCYLVSVAIHRGYSIKIGSKVSATVMYSICEAQLISNFVKDFPLNEVSYSKIMEYCFATKLKFPSKTLFNSFSDFLGSTNLEFHEQMQEVLESKNSLWSPECGNAFWTHCYVLKKMISYTMEKLFEYDIQLKKEKEKLATVITEKAPEPELSELVLKKRLSEATEALSKSKQKSDELSDLLTEAKNNLSEKNDLVKELQKKIADLEADLEETEDLLLKEDQVEEEDDTSLEADELEFLNGCRIVVVGGHDHLQKQLLDRVPNIRFIEPNSSQLDYNLIRNADIVSFMTNYCSHTIYQCVKQQAKLNKKKISHHNSNHANFICRTILNELLAD